MKYFLSEKLELALKTEFALNFSVPCPPPRTPLTLGVCHPCRIASDRLRFDETFAQPCIFAVMNCADVALRAFYSPVLTRWQIFCSYEQLCLRRPLLIYVHYSDTLYSLQQRVKRVRVE